MFDPIGEPNVRTIVRPEPNIEISEREIQTQQERKVQELRSIEKSENGSKIKKEKKEQENQRSAKYRQEDDKIIYEKYDKNGELIFRMPPKKRPVDGMIWSSNWTLSTLSCVRTSWSWEKRKFSRLLKIVCRDRNYTACLAFCHRLSHSFLDSASNFCPFRIAVFSMNLKRCSNFWMEATNAVSG